MGLWSSLLGIGQLAAGAALAASGNVPAGLAVGGSALGTFHGAEKADKQKSQMMAAAQSNAYSPYTGVSHEMPQDNNPGQLASALQGASAGLALGQGAMQAGGKFFDGEKLSNWWDNTKVNPSNWGSSSSSMPELYQGMDTKLPSGTPTLFGRIQKPSAYDLTGPAGNVQNEFNNVVKTNSMMDQNGVLGQIYPSQAALQGQSLSQIPGKFTYGALRRY